MAMTFNQMYDKFLVENDDNHDCVYFNDDTVVKKSELENRVQQIIRHLINLGARKGDGIGYTLYNHPDIIAMFIAISKIGAYCVPLFAGMPPTAKASTYRKTKVKYVITNEDLAKDLENAFATQNVTVKIAVIESNSKNFYSIFGDCTEVKDLEPYVVDSIECKDDTLMIGSSSGTTGIPKFVKMSQLNVGSEIQVSEEMFQDGWDTDENADLIGSVAFPLSTSVMLVLCGGLFGGVSLVFSDDFSSMNFLRMIDRWKSDAIIAPPAYYESCLLLKDKQNYDLKSVIRVAAGMDFCSPALLKRLKELFPNLSQFQNGYGLVETCNVYMYTTQDISKDPIHDTAKLKLANTADNEIQVRDENGKFVEIGEVGEIYMRGSNLVSGYLDDNLEMVESFENTWFRTGDIVRKEDARVVTMLGRKKYFIKRAGKSVSPIVVQSEINKTEGICDSCVVGVPHPLYGEMLWAFVVRKKNYEVSLKDIKIQCKKELPYYMLPDQVTFVDEIPKKGGVGKVDYETLKQRGKEELDKLGFNKI